FCLCTCVVPVEMQLSERDNDGLLEQAFELRQALALANKAFGEETCEVRMHAYHHRLRGGQSCAERVEPFRDYSFGRRSIEHLKLDHFVYCVGKRFVYAKSGAALP